jgi:hypothetical protein
VGRVFDTGAPGVQVLVDADNLTPARLRALQRATPYSEASVVVAGSPRALSRVHWPPSVTVVAVEGWQAADAELARAYRPGHQPLVLASGDGDFALLATGHAGPVLVVSGLPAGRLRAAGTVIDPIADRGDGADGVDALRRWFDAVLDQPFAG